MRIAIVGCRHGHIFALYNLIKASDRAEFCGAYEPDAATREEAERRYGMVFPYATLEELLGDESVDAVAIGDYYAARGGEAIAALTAGKHVIADKPLCTSLSELAEIERLSAERGLSVGLMLDLRYNGNVLRAKQLIEDGTLGPVHNIQFGGQHPLLYGRRPGWYFEEGRYGGVINDIAVHGVDLVTYLTGQTLRRVNAARCYNAYAKEEPHFLDCGQFMLTLSEGAGVLADVSYAAPNSMGYTYPYYWEFHVFGERGLLAFNAVTPGVTLCLDGESEPRTVAPAAPSGSMLDSFLDEIEGHPSHLTTAEVIATTRATLKVQRAADEAC